MRNHGLNKVSGAIMLLIVSILPTFSQSVEEIQDIIFDIQMDGNYIFGEASAETHQLAYDTALNKLLRNCNDKRSEKGIAELKQSDIAPLVSEYSYDRGGMELVFVYMEMDKMMSVTTKQSLNLQVDTSSEAATAPPMVSGTVSVPQVATVGEPAQTEEPSVAVAQPASFDYSDYVVMNLLEREMYDDAMRFLVSAKEKGRISDWGVAKSKEEIPADSYILVIDRTFSIQGYLSPVSGDTRYNLKTNHPDSPYSYKDSAFVWYRM